MNLREIDKSALLDQLVAVVERDLAQCIAAQKVTSEGATHEESRPENDKDTRALESSYLARGQARRVVELQEALTRLSAVTPRRFDGEHPIQSTALVELVLDDDSIELCWLLPVAGGVHLNANGVTITTVTLSAPLGHGLVGRTQGESFEVQLPHGPREYLIGSIA